MLLPIDAGPTAPSLSDEEAAPLNCRVATMISVTEAAEIAVGESDPAPCFRVRPLSKVRRTTLSTVKPLRPQSGLEPHG